MAGAAAVQGRRCKGGDAGGGVGGGAGGFVGGGAGQRSPPARLAASCSSPSKIITAAAAVARGEVDDSSFASAGTRKPLAERSRSDVSQQFSKGSHQSPPASARRSSLLSRPFGAMRKGLRNGMDRISRRLSRAASPRRAASPAAARKSQ